MREMKKYGSLSELILDYRDFKNMTQLDLATLLEVDQRTVARWEKGVSHISPEKEAEVVEKLFIPYQVLKNLNSENPIAIFYDLDDRVYSFSAIGVKIANTDLFKSDLPVDMDNIHTIDVKQDLSFIYGVHSLRSNQKPIDERLIKDAAEKLPDLNLILFDQAGFHAGHIVFLPLNLSAYERLKDKELDEIELNSADLIVNDDEPKIFYFYSLYADSIAHAYYLMSVALKFFQQNRFKDYIIAGRAYHPEGINMHREMGLKTLWEKQVDSEQYPDITMLEGNYDMYLFGKMA